MKKTILSLAIALGFGSSFSYGGPVSNEARDILIEVRSLRALCTLKADNDACDRMSELLSRFVELVSSRQGVAPDNGTRYTYNVETNQCMDTDGNLGYNIGVIGECGYLRKVDLSFYNLAHKNLKGAFFDRCKFFGTDLSLADLSGVHIFGGTMKSLVAVAAVFDQSWFYKLSIQGSQIVASSFKNSNLYKINLSKSGLVGSNFTGSSIVGSSFNASLLNAANFYQTNLAKSSFKKADLRNADFRLSQRYKTNFNTNLIEGILW